MEEKGLLGGGGEAVEAASSSPAPRLRNAVQACARCLLRLCARADDPAPPAPPAEERDRAAADAGVKSPVSTAPANVILLICFDWLKFRSSRVSGIYMYLYLPCKLW